MTIEQVRSRIDAITAPLKPTSGSAEFNQASQKMTRLMASLPPGPEFGSIANDIVDFGSKIAAGAAIAAVRELRERTGLLADANALLTKTAADAEHDARVLRFEQIKTVVNGLRNAADAVGELRTAIDERDFETAGAKAQELLEFLEHLHSLAKED